MNYNFCFCKYHPVCSWKLEIFLFCSAFINRVSFISKKYAVPIGHGNSFFGHGKVMENHCWKRVGWKRVVTLCRMSVLCVAAIMPTCCQTCWLKRLPAHGQCILPISHVVLSRWSHCLAVHLLFHIPVPSSTFSSSSLQVPGTSVVLCTEVAHSHKHTYMSSSYSSLDWVLSHWAHFTVHRFICVCVYLCFFVSYCIVVSFWARWGGPDGIEA